MKKIDKYERVAALARRFGAPSAFTIADDVCKLERLGSRMHRVATACVNGEVTQEERDLVVNKILVRAHTIALSYDLVAVESDDGMGYLRICTRNLEPGELRAIAVFGGDS